MLRSFIIIIVGIIFLLSFSSCTYDKEFAYLNDQIMELNRQVKRLQNSLDKQIGEKLDSKLQTIRDQQASMRVELDQMKTKVGEINGRVEDNENLIRSVVERDLKEQDTIKNTLVKLSERVDTLERMVRFQHEYLGLKPSESPGAPLSGIEEQPSRATIQEQQPVGEDQLYDRALNLYREGKYEDAIREFTDFIKRFPKSDKADNAHFWIGECYMALKQYEKAILSYQKVIKNYPQGNKVPNALLRQAIAFIQLNDKTSSKLLLKKIIKKYPHTTEARIAKKKLNSLK